MRVYEIAKEVGIANKDLIAKIRALGLEVNNHMSSLDADDVARIRRSLEKEKQASTAPQQTQRLSTGAVLRRRSSGDRDGDGAGSVSQTTTVRPTEPAKPAATATAPVVRRRVEDATARPAAAEPARTRPSEPAIARPEPVVARPAAATQEPAREERHERPAPRPERPERQHTERNDHEVAAPVVAANAAPAAAERTERTERVEPGHDDRPARVEAKQPVQVANHQQVSREPARPPVAVSETEPAAARTAAVEVVPTPAATPPASESAHPVVATPRPAVQPATPPVAPAVSPPVQPRPIVSTQSRVVEMRPAEPRVERMMRPPTQPPPTAQEPGPRTVEEIAGTARSRFELELERARARTAERDPAPPRTRAGTDGGTGTAESQVEEVVAVAAPPPGSPRDPSRPAVGSVISLPPRIKITERTPIGGRAAVGPQPVNPIRGRFAQQQQQRGPRPGGPGRPGGPHGRPGQNDFGRKKLPLGKKGKQTQLTTPAEHKRVIRMEDTINIGDLSRNMGIKAPEVLKKLWGMGMTGVNINASIDSETAQILASEFGYEVQNVAFKEEDVFAQRTEEQSELVIRSPVVTVMGHVDHGKTSLLDAIRKTRVVAGEAGGITQHVAAYKVPVKVDGQDRGDIVFLDTPGHEAFTEMRARGAQATDIVVLVVAANDGVMPQTLEALSHAKEAKVSIIVAVNKVDLPDAQPDRVRQQLADHGLIPEEWGGDTIYVNVSALRGENIDKLLEAIALTAEVLELKSSPDMPAAGLVIEARLDRNRGPMATVLIQEGTVRVGDVVVAGRVFGKVRAMLDDRGEALTEAGPSTPVELLGLDGVPEAGDQVNVADDDKIAKEVVEHRRQQFRKKELASTVKVSLENRMARMTEEAGMKELKIVLKADVQGSAEALKAALTKLSTEKVRVTVIAAAVGGITESDVHLAQAGGAIIVGFHVRPAGKSQKLAEQEGVEIRLYNIIYDALDDVKAAMAGLLAPIKREVAMGKLEVRETFAIPRMGTVAGCMVTDGKVNRKALLRVIRDAVQVYEGRVGSLRRFKEDVSEVQHGFECGVMVAGWNEVKQGDVIEAYEVIEEAAQL